MPFETLTNTRDGRRSTKPTIHIGTNNIYLNSFINANTKLRDVEIQIDKDTSRIRLIFKEKPTIHTRRVNKLLSAGVISFKGILQLLGLKEPITIGVDWKGNQITGTYREKSKP